MKIVALEAENIKYLKAIRVAPDGSLVIVGGDNSQGKSCVLDSIEYALNGAGSLPAKPIRAGQKKARVVLDLGDIQVTRTFTAKGTNLVVKSKDGATFPSPQAMLDKLVGKLTFDPLEFSKMDATKRVEVLKKLVGLDFDKLDAQHKKLFDERTMVNRKGKDLKSRLEGNTKYDGVPDKEVSVQKLGDDYAKALEHNQKLDIAQRAINAETDELERLQKRIVVLTKSIAQKTKALQGAKKVDAQSINAQMAEAESVNAKIRSNAAYALVDKELVELRKQSGSLSSQMTKITTDKEKALCKAKFPIEGLAIDDDGVTFEDIPFDQCSTSQQIKISVAMGLAMNPKLRVILIREGSLLDNKNLAMVADMAAEADAQIWCERVSKGSECSVIIEDGEVQE